MRASHDCTTVVRHSPVSVAIYMCERLTTVVRHSPECLTTFGRILISFIYRIVQIAETSLLCVCERLRRVGDGFATYAMTWRRFCDNFCHTKKYYMFKTLATRIATSSRCMRGFCDTMRTFRDSSRRFSESIRKPITNSSHPSEIGA